MSTIVPGNSIATTSVAFSGIVAILVLTIGIAIVASVVIASVVVTSVVVTSVVIASVVLVTTVLVTTVIVAAVVVAAVVATIPRTSTRSHVGLIDVENDGGRFLRKLPRCDGLGQERINGIQVLLRLVRSRVLVGLNCLAKVGLVYLHLFQNRIQLL